MSPAWPLLLAVAVGASAQFEPPSGSIPTDTALTNEQTAAVREAKKKDEAARTAKQISGGGGAQIPADKAPGWISGWWKDLPDGDKNQVKKHWQATRTDRDGNVNANLGFIGGIFGTQVAQESGGLGTSSPGPGKIALMGESVSAGVGTTLAAQPETQVSPDLLHSFSPGDRGFGDAQMALGTQYQQRGEHRAALGYYETAMSNGKDDARTLTFASLAALNAEEPRKASLWSAQALAKDPGGPLAEQAEAISKMAFKRLPKEEDPFAKRPPSRPPEGGAAPQGGTSVPELERPLPPREVGHDIPPEARAIFAESNRLVSLASKAYRGNDIKEALKLSNEALAKDPDDVRALQVRAAANAKEGNWEEARKDADKGLDMAPGYVPLLLLRAAAAAHAKDWKAVKADAQTVLAKEKANPTAWRFKGIAAAGLGDRQDAVASLSRAVQYGDHEAARLLATVRSLPPGADVVDLVEMLSGAAAAREAATDARTAPAPAPASRGNKTLLVFGAAVLAGLIAGGLILLAGRKDEESA